MAYSWERAKSAFRTNPLVSPFFNLYNYFQDRNPPGGSSYTGTLRYLAGEPYRGGQPNLFGAARYPSNIPSRPPVSEQSSTSEVSDELDGGIGTGTQANYITFNGNVYDINDTNQRLKFYQDRLNVLVQERDKYLASVEQQLGRSLSEAEKTKDANLATIDQDIADTETAASKFVQDYNQQVEEFTRTKEAGDIGRSSMFTRLSPNAFQSAEGSAARQAQNLFLQGLGDLAQQAAETVGTEFLANPTNYAALGTGSVLGRQRANLFQQRGDVTGAFGQYVRDVEAQREAERQKAEQYLQENKDTLASQLQPADISQGVNPFRYDRIGYAPAQTSQADLSRYAPYLNFQATPSSVTPGPTFQPRRGTNIFGENTPLESFLGRNRFNQQDIDYLRNYLLGR